MSATSSALPTMRRPASFAAFFTMPAGIWMFCSASVRCTSSAVRL